MLEHKHFKLPQPLALSDPMDLMTTIPREVAGPQVEEEGVGSVPSVDWSFDYEERQPGIHWFQSSLVLLRTNKILNSVRYCTRL